MNYRAAYLTLHNLEVLRVMLRMQWVNAAQSRAVTTVNTKEVSLADLVAEFVDVTDHFAPLLAALEVWAFQLKSNNLNGAEVIMVDQLHKDFTIIAEADYSIYLNGNLSEGTRELMTKMLEDQPAIVKVLQEAATIDPDAITKGAKTLPGGKWSPMLN